jgi:subtilisin family serine protease
MLKKLRIVLLLLGLLASCGNPPSVGTPTPKDETPLVSIERYPKPSDYSGLYLELTSIPKFDSNSDDPWQVDLRSRDLSKIDMTDSLADLLYATFDSKTQWPASDKIPAGFDWQKIMEIGKDPGLGMRSLHEQGIAGQGVGIAIIDQPLLVDHQEYRDRLQLYEEINILPDSEAAMHGAAVASIAVGKTVGVAPGADLYYIGAWTGDWEPSTNNFTWNFKYYAQAVRRILEINQDLPEDRKIRVIAMQVGWSPDQVGYDDITAAVNEAKAEGILIVCSNLSDIYGFNFQGMGRDSLADPNQFESYVPGLWWAKNFYDGMPLRQALLIPMDSRTTASPTGTEDYAFYRTGGWSWSIPYLAGTYALAVQVKPDITPEEFWATALETGKTIQLTHEGKKYAFGAILDPQALIAALQ